MSHLRRCGLALLVFFLVQAVLPGQDKTAGSQRYLYVVAPGVRNYLQFGGSGIMVFDIDRGHTFQRRIQTPASQLDKPENIKGVCASAATQKLYFSTLTRLYCLDLLTDRVAWERALPDGCDRMSITPDGRVLYVPTMEKKHWNVVDGAPGKLIVRIPAEERTHNTNVSRDGSRMYLASIGSNYLAVADTATHQVVQKVGPFGAGIRPFTVNADSSLCFVNVNELLGFEIGDLKTGKVLQRVEVADFKPGPVKRHSCPSHGVGLTPDEKEVWVCDAHNSRMHVFDATVMPPRQVASIVLREQPGWITFSGDGRYAYPSTGEVIDTKTRKIIVGLRDEEGREVHSEKVIELIFAGGRVIWAGDQFGVGRRGQSVPAP
jgi:DNA-binding beta-propeller fold protein YncE